jgi:hypothetical protein
MVRYVSELKECTSSGTRGPGLKEPVYEGPTRKYYKSRSNKNERR